MSGHPGYFRITVGEYRVIYRTHGDTVHVVVVGSRNDDDVYRKFDRLD
jgi:mRNA interferase RelE/StbE